jgi:hypothetical protein
MEGFFIALSLTLTPQTVFSMLGGGLGALIASDRKRYGWQLSILFGIAALALAAATGEYLVNSRDILSVWWLLVLNIPLGMVVGSTLDVLRITSPPLIERLVRGIGDSGVNIIVETILEKLSGLLGVRPPDFSRDKSKKINHKNLDAKDLEKSKLVVEKAVDVTDESEGNEQQ